MQHVVVHEEANLTPTPVRATISSTPAALKEARCSNTNTKMSGAGDKLMHQLSMVWKIAITLIAFLVAIGIASIVFQIFFNHSYPAWTMIAALAIISPLVFLLWRDRFSQ